MVRRLATMAAVSLILLGCSPRDAARPPLAAVETAVLQAAFADGRLWLVSDIALLSSISEAPNDRVWEEFPDRVVELWVQEDQPAIITCDATPCSEWIIRRRTATGWKIEGTLKPEDERIMAVGGAENTLLLTSRRLITVDSGQISSVPLSSPIDLGGITAMHVTPEYVYAGLSRGEFGGGLLRLHRATGEITTIERNESGGLCGGPLNVDCDPVNGVAPAPWDPACLVLVVGLEHLISSHGRIVEVCGDDAVQRLYFEPLRDARSVPGNDEPFGTVAFYQLVQGENRLWTSGRSGFYRIDDRTQVQAVPMPEFRSIEGVYVSFDLPGIVVARSKMNQPTTDESIPILIPR